LRSWTPRLPSAAIKERLFPSPPHQAQAIKIFWWLAPAAVCLLVTLGVLKSDNNDGLPVSDGPLMAMIWSNRSSAAYASARSTLEEHNVLRSTFSWTNLTGSNSSSGFSPITTTNE
jgi:hypothetical protein